MAVSIGAEVFVPEHVDRVADRAAPSSDGAGGLASRGSSTPRFNAEMRAKTDAMRSTPKATNNALRERTRPITRVSATPPAIA